MSARKFIPNTDTSVGLKVEFPGEDIPSMDARIVGWLWEESWGEYAPAVVGYDGHLRTVAEEHGPEARHMLVVLQ